MERVLTRRLNRTTLLRQLSSSARGLAPAAAISRLAGLQAEWAPSPYVALWSRLEDFRRREQLEQAMIRGSVVKATLMRATLHLVIAKNGDVAETFLVDGLVAGRWQIERGRVVLEPFERLPVRAHRELAGEARRLEAFVR